MQAWRSLEKANSALLRPGDSLLFRSGRTWSGQLRVIGSGSPDHPVTIDSYGAGTRPRIDASGQYTDAVLISNAQHVVVRGLEITNQGRTGSGTNTPPRRGVHIVADNVGSLTNIVVSDLFIHDVNGTQRIKDNGGIIFTIRGQRVPSRFVGLRIERNIVWRVDRSGIVAQSYHARRDRWFPSLDVVVRDNWLGDLGGDGVTPWATDGCVLEHNIVEGANERAGTYNAGIWPWSTDHTIMRLNRASRVKTLLDGQGFDADYNSRNTLIEYNLSHDNEGGFLLICTPGKRNPQENCGNPGTVVRRNISRYDGARIVHIAGAVEQATLTENAFYIAPGADIQLLLLSEWSGWPNGVEIRSNLFHSEGIARYGHQVSRDYQTGAYGLGPGWGPATNIAFSGNAYVGQHESRPIDASTSPGSAPRPIAFNDWPGPQFIPTNPDHFPDYLRAHRAWMGRLIEAQFGDRVSASPR